MKKRLFLCLSAVVLLAWTEVGVAQQSKVPPEVWEKAQREGVVLVIVGLDVPTKIEGRMSPEARQAHQKAIATVQDELLAELAGTQHKIRRKFQNIPGISLEARPDALAVLERSPRVVDVKEVRVDKPHLSQSAPLVEAPQAWAAGFDGTGWEIAILDTGVDKDHPFLAGKVVAEACFSGNSNCPNGSTEQIGSEAGVPCTYAVNGCQHGTHVAGISAGEVATLSGVAKGAKLIAIQVFSRFIGPACIEAGEDPCALSFEDDQIVALDHVINLAATRQIASANMSLGGGRFTDQESCDAANSQRKIAIDALRAC
jgi:subtilisin